MPWTFSGAPKKVRARKRGGPTKPRSRGNLGRRLVNAGVREIMKELEEKENKERKAGAAKPPPPPVPHSKRKVAPLASSAAAPPANNVKNPIEMSIKKAIAARAAAAAEARREEFTRFWNLLPSASSRPWRNANNVAPGDKPSGLSKHVSESIMVFSFAHNNYDGILKLGATFYRRNNRKRTKCLEKKATVILHFAKDDKGTIVHRWTDWEPNCSDVERMRPGIYIKLVQDYMVPSPTSVCVVRDEDHLLELDNQSAFGLDVQPMHSHYVFANNAMTL